MNQFVSCGGIDCSVCSLLETISLIFRSLLGVSASLAALALIIGGIIYILNTGSKKREQLAKRIINYAISGFIFVLIAFISIHSLIWIIGGSSQISWWKVDCTADIDQLITNTTYKNQATSQTGDLLTELEDAAPIVTDASSLNKLMEDYNKIIIFNTDNLESQNLRQDLLNLYTGQKIRLLGGAKDITPDELKAFIAIENGYIDDLTQQYSTDDLNQKIQDLVDFSRNDGDLDINSKTLPEISEIYSGNDPDLDKKIDRLISSISSDTNKNIIAYKNARSEGSLSSCVDSGGDWTAFANECLARKQIYGYEDLKCSNVKNSTMGCTCPTGKLLINGSCVTDAKAPTDKDEAPSEYCNGRALQEITCPATRCEGSNLVTYPASGKDQCVNGVYQAHSCQAVSNVYNDTCNKMNNYISPIDKENVAKKDRDTYNKLKDFFNRSNPDNGQSNGGNGSGNNGSGNNGGTNNGGSGDRTGGDQTGKTPPDLGPGNYNPTPSAKALAECIGFKDGKIPYNGVLVTLLNKDDPTNANHPKNNASRLFYLDRYGNIIGNAGDKNAGGLKVGPWTRSDNKGTAWSPEWVIFNAQTTHTNSRGENDAWSFNSGSGYRIGPKGEGMNNNGTLNNGSKPATMTGCNMHSGYQRGHSLGCMTMGGNERKAFTEYVKKMATQSGGTIMMAVLPAENTDPGSQTIKSDYCGNMDPEAAVKSFKNLSQYRNYDPMQGYN